MARTERYNVELNATDNASAIIEQVAEARDRLSDDPVLIDIEATDDASEVIEDVGEAADDLDGQAAEVELSADDEASEPVTDVAEAIDELDGQEAEVELTADDQASPVVEDAQSAVDSFDGEADVTLTATDEASDTIEGVAEAVDELDGDSASVDVEVTGDDADAVTEVGDALEELDGDEASVDIEVTGDDATDVSEVGDALEELDGDSATADVEVTGDDESAVSDVSGALDDLDGSEASASLSVDGAADTSGDIGDIVGNLETLAAGVLTGLAGTALTGVFSSAAENVLNIQAIADASGDTLEDATGIKEAFEFIGADTKVQQMITRVNDALNESPELARRLGIEIGGNQTPLDIFVATVDKLNSGQLTANERLALATELFGSRGVTLLNNLDTQVGNLRDSIESTPEWQVVTEDDIEAAIEFKETMDQIRDAVGEIAQAGLQRVAPIIEGISIALGSIPTPDVPGDLGLGEFLVGGSDAIDTFIARVAESEDVADQLEATVGRNVITASEWSRILEDNVVTQGELNSVLDEGHGPLEILRDAVNDMSEALSPAEEAQLAFTAAQEAAAVEARALTTELSNQIEELEASAEAHRDQAEAIQDSADGYLDEREKLRDAEDALDDYHAAMQPVEDDTRTAAQVTRDQQRALDAVVLAYDDASDATVEHTRQTLAGTGVTLKDSAALQLKTTELLQHAATLQGPEKRALIEHTLRLNGIPEEKITEIFTNTNPDDIAEAKTILNDTAAARVALMLADVADNEAANAERQLDNIARDRIARVIPQVTGGFGFQHGTPHSPRGVALVGETGPELVALPEGSEVLTHQQTLEALRNRGGGGGDTFVQNNTINMPAGTRPRDVLRADRASRRRNGAPVPA